MNQWMTNVFIEQPLAFPGLLTSSVMLDSHQSDLSFRHYQYFCDFVIFTEFLQCKNANSLKQILQNNVNAMTKFLWEKLLRDVQRTRNCFFYESLISQHPNERNNSARKCIQLLDYLRMINESVTPEFAAFPSSNSYNGW